MPCEIRPIAEESPQTRFYGNDFWPKKYSVHLKLNFRLTKSGRGLGTNSGESPKDGDLNVPYKKIEEKLIYRIRRI